MHDTDEIQVWRRTVNHRACEVGGRFEATVTETLDWTNRTITYRTRGEWDGEWLDETYTRPIPDDAVSIELAAKWRRSQGYIRISEENL